MKSIKELLTPEEVELAQASNTGHTGAINETRVVSQLYVAMRQREMADDMIAANNELRESQRKMADDMIQVNKDLAAASGRNATALNWVTAGLVVVGLLQAWLIWTVSQ